MASKFFSFSNMKLKLAFKHFDKDNSGYIEVREIEALLTNYLHVPASIAGKASKVRGFTTWVSMIQSLSTTSGLSCLILLGTGIVSTVTIAMLGCFSSEYV